MDYVLLVRLDTEAHLGWWAECAGWEGPQHFLAEAAPLDSDDFLGNWFPTDEEELKESGWFKGNISENPPATANRTTGDVVQIIGSSMGGKEQFYIDEMEIDVAGNLAWVSEDQMN